ncbi:kinase-like protein [Rhizophagus irregularis]|nr:kinase-like protein [Rhizophagus irregularis]
MVFEYADRNNLRIFLKSLKLDLMIRVKLSLDIAKGLSYLHQLKIIHRDLHSNNIVINQVHSCDQLEFIAKITDFGSAINEEDDDINDKTGVIGQIPFTDPQYLNNPKHYRKNMKSDIYSLGVILWEISSSKAPFENFMADSRGEFRDLCLTFEIINDYRERHTLFTPENFVKLSRQCWDNDPNKRPDIKTVIDDLNSIFAGLPQVLERNATIGQ